MRREVRKGFTLLEVLLVVAAIGILAGIVIVAINPGKQLGDARDGERASEVNTLLSAVYQYSVDNGGSMPASITTTATEICSTTGEACESLVDLGVLIADQKYLVAIPEDPQDASANGTGYTIVKSANGRITVSAPNAENGTVSVTR